MEEGSRDSGPGGTRQLLVRERSGDRAALEQLYERPVPRVRRIAALRMRCRESELWDHEDLVQETLLEAFLGLERFEERHDGALCHWIAKMVVNNLRDHRRRRHAGKRDARRVPRRSSSLSESVFGHDSRTPSGFAVAAEFEQHLESALLALAERERRVIELRRLCELSYEEIALELGFSSASSARSLFSRAMSALAERL